LGEPPWPHTKLLRATHRCGPAKYLTSSKERNCLSERRGSWKSREFTCCIGTTTRTTLERPLIDCLIASGITLISRGISGITFGISSPLLLSRTNITLPRSRVFSLPQCPPQTVRIPESRNSACLSKQSRRSDGKRSRWVARSTAGRRKTDSTPMSDLSPAYHARGRVSRLPGWPLAPRPGKAITRTHRTERDGPIPICRDAPRARSGFGL
jgi:hypothetical protein